MNRWVFRWCGGLVAAPSGWCFSRSLARRGMFVAALAAAWTLPFAVHGDWTAFNDQGTAGNPQDTSYTN